MSVQRLYNIMNGDNTLKALISPGDIAQAQQLDASTSVPKHCVRFWSASYQEELASVVHGQSFVVVALSKMGMVACEAIMKRLVYTFERHTEGGILKVKFDGAVGPYWSEELKAWRADVRVTLKSTI